MNTYAFIISLVAILVIHLGLMLSYKIKGSFNTTLIKIISVIAGFSLLAILSNDINTSVKAGRYFFFVSIGYFLLYQFYLKKEWKKLQPKNTPIEE